MSIEGIPQEENQPQEENEESSSESRVESGIESIAERRLEAFTKVSKEFFKKCESIREAIQTDPTVEIAGETVPIGEDSALHLVAMFERVEMAAQELKQSAEYQKDYESARIATYFLQLAEAELHKVQTKVDIVTHIGGDALESLDAFDTLTKTLGEEIDLREAANDETYTKAA